MQGFTDAPFAPYGACLAPRQKYPDVILFNRVGIAPRFTVLAARWARG